MTYTIVVLPDIHAPTEDRKAFAAVVDFIGEYQPDEVVMTGDLCDFPQPSRWSKGSAEEFAETTVFDDSDYIKRKILTPLRKVYGGKIGFIEGNHDERPRVYLAKYAPALAASVSFDVKNLLDFEGFGIKQLPDFYRPFDRWVLCHGHKGGIRLKQKPGETALGGAQKFMENVVHGHTHRLAALPHTYGVEGDTKLLWGMEVGHLMNPKLVTYLKGGTGNWQQGFGILTKDGDHVSPHPVPIYDSRFVVDGNVYHVL